MDRPADIKNGKDGAHGAEEDDVPEYDAVDEVFIKPGQVSAHEHSHNASKQAADAHHPK